MQSEPAGQGAEVPQRQAPCGLQLSARFGSHATHAEPLSPHDAGLRFKHCGPEQHPFGQLVAVQLLQMPASQAALPGQFWHCRPPVPHCIDVVPGRHWLAWQQPLQLAVVHWHVPFATH